MKKSSKVLLYGLLASILLILFCLYAHQDMFINKEKDNQVESAAQITYEGELNKELIVDKNDTKQEKSESFLKTIKGVTNDNNTTIDKNSSKIEENRSHVITPRTIFKNKEEIKLKEHHPKREEVQEEKIEKVDKNLPIEDNKPLIDNKKESKKTVSETLKKSSLEKGAEKTKDANVEKKKKKAKVAKKSFATLQGEISNIVSHNISFYKNRAKITSKGRSSLDKVIKILKTLPNAKIVVKGYTDASGDEKTNLWISQERAKSVKRYLSKHGIPTKNIIAKGYGESELLYGDKPNSELNRRVEIEIKRR